MQCLHQRLQMSVFLQVLTTEAFDYTVTTANRFALLGELNCHILS